MPAHADTDGLMDACALCGGIPGILESIRDGAKRIGRNARTVITSGRGCIAGTTPL